MLKLVIYMTIVQPGQALSRLDKIIFAWTKIKNCLDRKLDKIWLDKIFLIGQKIKIQDFFEIEIKFQILKMSLY